MKYLAVDLGNVICRVNFTDFKKKLSKQFNVDMEYAEYFLNRTQRFHDSGLTNISDELRDFFNIKSSVVLAELMEEWNLTIQPDVAMISMLKDMISPKNNEQVKVALLSNIGPEHANIMSLILTREVFDNSIRFFSCEVGARKPSYLYYKTFLDMYPEFKGCVYIDDRIENIEVGTEMGLNGIHFVLDQFCSGKDLADGIEKIKKLVYSL
jgi:FMN phosphatase YigB (HAD superfamily)